MKAERIHLSRSRERSAAGMRLTTGMIHLSPAAAGERSARVGARGEGL